MDFRDNLFFLRGLLPQVFFYLLNPIFFPVFLPQKSFTLFLTTVKIKDLGGVHPVPNFRTVKRTAK